MSVNEYQWPPKIPTEKGAKRAWEDLYTAAYQYGERHIPTGDGEADSFYDVVSVMQNSSFLGARLQNDDFENPEVRMWFGHMREKKNEYLTVDRVRHLHFPSVASTEIIQGLGNGSRGIIARLLTLRYLTTHMLGECPESPMGVFPVWEYDQDRYDAILPYEIVKLRPIYEAMLFGKDAQQQEELHRLFDEGGEQS